MHVCFIKWVYGIYIWDYTYFALVYETKVVEYGFEMWQMHIICSDLIAYKTEDTKFYFISFSLAFPFRNILLRYVFSKPQAYD